MAGIQKKQVEVIQAGSGGMSFKPEKKVEEQGRNDDCACGSGKKYKKCHGATI